jgi:hypothetical protein
MPRCWSKAAHLTNGPIHRGLVPEKAHRAGLRNELADHPAAQAHTMRATIYPHLQFNCK